MFYEKASVYILYFLKITELLGNTNSRCVFFINRKYRYIFTGEKEMFYMQIAGERKRKVSADLCQQKNFWCRSEGRFYGRRIWCKGLSKAKPGLSLCSGRQSGVILRPGSWPKNLGT
jgi:hypothetical protein